MPRCPHILSLLVAATLLVAPAVAQDAAKPKPTLADVPYGAHERQKLDFYQAKSDGPAPLFFFIHGGGWVNGDKSKIDFLDKCLASGVSVVSINYRFIQHAQAEKIEPPVKACLHDAARALQFVRSKAAEWKLDPTRVALCGGSAGGFSSLWLAFHPDLADPKSDDPIARQSTRVTCALVFVPQTTLDPKQMQEWTPNNQYGNHAFGLPSMQEFLKQRDKYKEWIAEYSPYELATSDDPPVLLFYDNAPAMGQPSKDPPHSANWGAGLAEKMKAVGIEHEMNYNNDWGKMKYPDLFGFFTAKLKLTPAK